MAVTPTDYVVSEDLIDAAYERIRREGDGCIVSIYQLLAELSDKFNDRFLTSEDTYKVLELIEALWGQPHINSPHSEWVEFVWSDSIRDESARFDALWKAMGGDGRPSSRSDDGEDHR